MQGSRSPLCVWFSIHIEIIVSGPCNILEDIGLLKKILKGEHTWRGRGESRPTTTSRSSYTIACSYLIQPIDISCHLSVCNLLCIYFIYLWYVNPTVPGRAKKPPLQFWRAGIEGEDQTDRQLFLTIFKSPSPAVRRMSMGDQRWLNIHTTSHCSPASRSRQQHPECFTSLDFQPRPGEDDVPFDAFGPCAYLQ